jgi:hypothetical protein
LFLLYNDVEDLNIGRIIGNFEVSHLSKDSKVCRIIKKGVLIFLFVFWRPVTAVSLPRRLISCNCYVVASTLYHTSVGQISGHQTELGTKTFCHFFAIVVAL